MNSGKPLVRNRQLSGSLVALIVVTLISIAAVATFVFVYAMPAQTDLLSAKSELEAKKNEYDAAQLQYTLDRIDAEKLNQLFLRMPHDRLESVYLNDLNDWAAEHKLVIRSMALSGARADVSETDDNRDGAAGNLDMVTISLSVAGQLPHMQLFITKLHETTPYLGIKRWSLSRGQANDNDALNLRGMVLDLVLETYMSSAFSHLLDPSLANDPDQSH